MIPSCVPLLALLAACSQPQTQSAPASPPEDSGWEERYAEMAAVLTLTPEEDAHLRDTIQREYDGFRDWMAGPGGQAVRDEDAALKAAVKSKNVAAVRGITQGKTERSKMRERLDAVEAAVMAAVPPAQQPVWHAYELANDFIEGMAEVGLSPEQEATIRSGALEAYLGAEQRGEPEPARAGFLDLEVWVEQSVLSPEQVAAYAEYKKSRPMRSLI